ncbi:MAG: hypothetical protein ACRDV4_03320 [Acidimicrobiales bacterium]
MDDYSPAAGSALTDTVTVTACDASDTTNCASQPATSNVSTPPAVVTTPAAPVVLPATKVAASTLPVTGAPAYLVLLLEAGLAMLSVGFFVLWFTRPRKFFAQNR